MKKLESTLKDNENNAYFYEQMQQIIKKLGISEEIIDRFADSLHIQFCPEKLDKFSPSCDYNLASEIGTPTPFVNERDNFTIKAIRILKGLKQRGIKFDIQNIAEAAAKLKK